MVGCHGTQDVEILNWVLEIGSQNGSASRAGTKNMFKPLQLQHMQYAAKRKMTIVNIIKVPPSFEVDIENVIEQQS